MNARARRAGLLVSITMLWLAAMWGSSGAASGALMRDSPDRPLTLDIGPSGDLYFGMWTDVADLGGVARLDPDCNEVARWLTGPVMDVGVNRDGDSFVAERGWMPAPNRVARYDGIGVAVGSWDVAGAGRIDVASGGEVYVAVPGANSSSRILKFDATGRQTTEWAVAGKAIDIAVRDDGVLVIAEPPGATGSVAANAVVHWFASDGSPMAAWQPSRIGPLTLDVGPDGSVFVFGHLPGARDTGSRVVRYATDPSGVTEAGSWEVGDVFPGDIAVDSAGDVWLLARRMSRTPDVALHYTADGAYIGECTRFPQPLILTETPPPGTVTTPPPTPSPTPSATSTATVTPTVTVTATATPTPTTTPTAAPPVLFLPYVSQRHVLVPPTPTPSLARRVRQGHWRASGQEKELTIAPSCHSGSLSSNPRISSAS